MEIHRQSGPLLLAVRCALELHSRCLIGCLLHLCSHSYLSFPFQSGVTRAFCILQEELVNERNQAFLEVRVLLLDSQSAIMQCYRSDWVSDASYVSDTALRLPNASGSAYKYAHEGRCNSHLTSTEQPTRTMFGKHR